MIDFLLFADEKVHQGRVLLGKARAFAEEYLNANWLRSTAAAHLSSAIFALALCNMTLRIFSLQTLLSVAFLLYAARRLLLERWKAVREHGLIHYLPTKLQAILLRRSIFDVLCDTWFYPRLGLYAKAVFLPMIFKIKPETAMEQLDILPEADRNVVLTKGVVYTLPKGLQQLLLPKSYRLHNKIHAFLREGELEEEEENSPVKIKDIKRTKRMDSWPHTAEFLNASEGSMIQDVAEINFAMQRIESADDKDKGLTATQRKLKRANSRVIISSEMVKELKHLPGQLADAWDNLNLYNQEKQTRNALRKRSDVVEEHSFLSHLSGEEEEERSLSKRAQSAVSPLNLVFQMIELRKQKFLKRVSTKALVSIFLVCLTIFGLKIGLSPQYRNLAKRVVMNASLLIIVATGSLSLLAISMKTAERRSAHAAKNR